MKGPDVIIDIRAFLATKSGGAGGVRTPYLLRAKQAFSQLNYGPTHEEL
jgi:hypothetical protein